jgi:predicted membrane protein
MEILDPEQKRNYEARGYEQFSRNYDPKGRILAGLIVLTVGALLFARKMGVYLPAWLFSWQMLLITIGLFIGAKQYFRPGGWLIPVFIGCFMLVSDYLPEWNIRPYLFPAILMIAGLIMIITPGNRFRKRRFTDKTTTSASTDDSIDSVSFFGGNKKNIISRDFKGGESICIFGGSEINLSQADITGKVELEIIQIFGGTKLILPPHWQLKSDMVSILGGIEDSRVGNKENVMPDKILVLKGVSILGGISIKSF